MINKLTPHDPTSQQLFGSYAAIPHLQQYPGGPLTAVNHQQMYQSHHHSATQQPWSRPNQFGGYPYGGTASAAAAAAYMPNQYQPVGVAPVMHGPGGNMGLGSNVQNPGYYPNYRTRLQAMASQNMTKDNPQVKK